MCQTIYRLYERCGDLKLFASIYVGSYEVTMKVFEVSKQKGIKEIDCLKTQTDIISDIMRYKYISKETTTSLCAVLSDMRTVIEGYHVDDYRAYVGVNISAADNSLFVIEQIKLKTGLNISIIRNSWHRFLGYEAIASMSDFDEMIKESALLVDVGGTSLQITLFSKGKIITTQHIMLGTVAVKENLKKLAHLENYKEQINEVITKELSVFADMFLRDISPKYMILLGDQVSYIFDSVVKYKENNHVTTERYRKFVSDIDKEKVSKYTTGVDFLNDNDEIIEPFIMLHRAIANILPSEEVVIPGLSICEGIAYDYSYENKWLISEHDFDQDVLSAAWSIALRYGSYQPHLKALCKMSNMIFDTTKKYHGMDKRYKLLLEVACILHDCGKYISIAASAECSKQIIMSNEILGLTHKEREIIAAVVASNKMNIFDFDQNTSAFTEDEYIIIAKLLAILKVANALDRSHKQKLKHVTMRVSANQLIINIESSASMALERGLFTEKADFFESVFSIRPVLREKRL